MDRNSELKIIKEDHRGVVYDCGEVMFVSRKEGSVTADHSHDDESETLYLVRGKIELTIEGDVREIQAPAKIFIPAVALPFLDDFKPLIPDTRPTI
jgi:glyoxylate utilization-related uncharacterized protein